MSYHTLHSYGAEIDWIRCSPPKSNLHQPLDPRPLNMRPPTNTRVHICFSFGIIPSVIVIATGINTAGKSFVIMSFKSTVISFGIFSICFIPVAIHALVPVNGQLNPSWVRSPSATSTWLLITFPGSR